MTLETICLYSGITFTVMYALIAILSMIGHDHHIDIALGDHDFDVDVDNDGDFQILTVKNFIAFMVGLSWGTLAGLNDFGFSKWGSIFLGLGAGSVLVFLHALFMFIMAKFEKKQVPSLNSAVGQVGTVYLSIPDGGRGKLTVDVNGTSKTLDAISRSGYIQTGQRAKVIEIDGDTLIVQPN